MVHFDSQTEISEISEAEELDGKLAFSNLDDKLMHSVMENDKRTIDHANLIKESINRGVGAFTPDLMFEKLVDNFQLVKNIVGPSIIRQLTGYDDRYVEKNIRIPEFQMDIKKKVQQNLNELKKEGLLNRDGTLSDKAMELAALSCFIEEIEHLVPKGTYGKKEHKKVSHYGGKEEVKTYRKGDRYRDIALKSSIKTAIRRGHKKLQREDLKSFERQSKGQIHIIYALDASGSMKGDKLGTSKKAGVALAYRATQEKDKVGLIVFGSKVTEAIAPTDNLVQLIKAITEIRASQETDFVETINKSIELFENDRVTKHLVLLTDALPTVGKDPIKKTLEAVEHAANHNITISVVGINIDEKGRDLAEKIIEISNGRFYVIRDLDQLDRIILEDYYSL